MWHFCYTLLHYYMCVSYFFRKFFLQSKSISLVDDGNTLSAFCFEKLKFYYKRYLRTCSLFKNFDHSYFSVVSRRKTISLMTLMFLFCWVLNIKQYIFSNCFLCSLNFIDFNNNSIFFL